MENPCKAIAEEIERPAQLYWYRFKVFHFDPRPKTWPIEFPYWCTGYSVTNGNPTIVAYATSLEYVNKNWPEAYNIEYKEVDGMVFSARFPKPDWYKD